ncbi:hypothetical protein CPT_Silence46 [Bacillus phage Silence]|nr:hypothetical protein CPT_Silence46 [Bacillus phage Silence]
MYKKDITTYEYVYLEAEQKRLEEIQQQLERLAGCDVFSSEKMKKLVDEMSDILSGVWAEPMPF